MYIYHIYIYILYIYHIYIWIQTHKCTYTIYIYTIYIYIYHIYIWIQTHKCTYTIYIYTIYIPYIYTIYIHHIYIYTSCHYLRVSHLQWITRPTDAGPRDTPANLLASKRSMAETELMSSMGILGCLRPSSEVARNPKRAHIHI